MFIALNRYETEALYKGDDGSTLDFFLNACRGAYKLFKRGKKIDKKDAVVVFGTSIQDFDEETDRKVRRIEMNQRGVLRDFIGIDWDFDKGDEKRLEALLFALNTFHNTYKTPIIVYPTHSYPEKPRVRTVMFTKAMMNKSEYAKAVTFVVDTLGVDPNDDGNFNITHNFNLPVINSQAQKQGMKFFNERGSELLDNMLWANVVPKIKVGAQRPVKRTPVDAIESTVHTRKEVDHGLQQLSMDMKKGEIKSFDFNQWMNFFQFLHSVARAESIGSISRDDATYILTRVAGGNPEWERKNLEDYEREFPRVHGNQVKLESARPLAYYFGLDW